MSLGFALRRRALIAAGVVASIVVPAVTGLDASAVGATRHSSHSGSPMPGVFRIGAPSDPSSLDPSVADDSVAWSVLNNLSRGLVWANPKTMKPEPSMATSWKVTNGGRTYTFHLRKAKFSNGDPIVASDFVFSWRRQLDPTIGGPDATLMGDIVGAQNLINMASASTPPSRAVINAALNKVGVSAPNAHTFVVHLVKPYPALLDMATALPFVPEQPKWISSKGLTDPANDVSSGPFELVSWVHNSKLVLKPNPNWYGVKPQIKKLEFIELPDFTSALEAYRANEVDLIEVQTATVPHLPAALKSQYKAVDVLGQGYYTYNLVSGPTTNLNFRIALTEAINLKQRNDVVNAGLPLASYSWIPPGMPGYSAHPHDPYEYNVAGAKRHLALALQQMHLSSASQIPPLNLIFESSGDPEQVTNAAYIAAQWQSVLGIQVQQNGLEPQAYRTARAGKQFNVSRDAWLASYDDTGGMMSPVFACGGARNFSGFCNTNVDRQFTEAETSRNPAVAAALYSEIQSEVLSDAVIMPQAISLYAYLVKPYVHGLKPSRLDSELDGDTAYEYVSVK